MKKMEQFQIMQENLLKKIEGVPFLEIEGDIFAKKIWMEGYPEILPDHKEFFLDDLGEPLLVEKLFFTSDRVILGVSEVKVGGSQACGDFDTYFEHWLFELSPQQTVEVLQSIQIAAFEREQAVRREALQLAKRDLITHLVEKLLS